MHDRRLEEPQVASLDGRVTAFAELRQLDALVRRWVKHYEERDLISDSDALSIRNDASGKTVLAPEQAAKVLEDTEREFATHVGTIRDLAPDKAAYLFARRAKLRKSAGHDFSSDVQAAQELLAGITITPKQRPSLECLRAYALLSGIQGEYVQKMSKPDLSELIDYTKNGETVSDGMLEIKETKIRDVALTLDENEREQYLAAFPPEKRIEVSVLLDLYVSKVLHSNIPTTPDEIQQAKYVEERASTSLKNMVQSGDFVSLPRILKLVCLTLAELDSVESTHVLNEVGQFGLQREHVMPRTASRTEVLKRWSGFARILKADSDIPSMEANAGMLGMKYLALANLPDRLFNFFLRKMVQTGFLTTNALSFPTSDRGNKDLLHELITKYPSQFNTIIDTLVGIQGFNASTHSRDVLDALSHLHTLVPETFEAYIVGRVRDRERLVDAIERSRAHLYENQPIEKNGSPPEVPLMEHVYMATEPVNMSFARFKRMFARLTDRTFDLHRYKFPWGGYEFELKGGGRTAPKLKEGQEVNVDMLEQYRQSFSIEHPVPSGETSKGLLKVLENLVKGGTLQARDKNTALLFSLLAQDSERTDFVSEFPHVDTGNAYSAILGLEPFFEDAEVQEVFARRLEEFLQANSEGSSRLLDQCKNPQRFSTLVKRIQSATKQGFHLGVEIPEQITDLKDVADLMTASIYASSLLPMRRELSKEKKKYETPRDKRDIKNIDNLKAYVSKNVAAFFARAAVGICTFEDVSSWNRENYFHINVVEDDQHLRANIQAFVIRLEGKPVLLLRGINPSSPFLKRIDTGAFCEEILKIAKQFQEDNDLAGVYISEQAEWHALSNRQPVYEYLIDAYVKPENEVILEKPMVMSKTVGIQSIEKIYKIT